MKTALKSLADELKEVKRDRFSEGSVISWLSAGLYRYAAIKAGGRWWITGGAGFYGSSVFMYDELVEILKRSDVSDVRCVATWAFLEEDEDEDF